MAENRLLPQGNNVALYDNVFYNVPGLFSFSSLIYRYIEIVNAKFDYNVPITCMYGSPSVKWNGGRLLKKNKECANKKEIETEIYKAVQNHIVPLITFSNLEVYPEDLNDVIGNYVLYVLNEVSGGVIVASSLLEDYIRENYPNIRIHASVICTTLIDKRPLDYYEHLSQVYDRFVVNPDDLFSDSLISQIPKKNAEILVNERCRVNCTLRKFHYYSISREQRSFVDGTFVYEDFLKKCDMIPEYKQLCLKENNISFTAQEVKKLLGYGFRYIKLQGRIDNLYTVFFDLMRYTLNNEIAFPHLYPMFIYEIERFIKEGE